MNLPCKFLDVSIRSPFQRAHGLRVRVFRIRKVVREDRTPLSGTFKFVLEFDAVLRLCFTFRHYWGDLIVDFMSQSFIDEALDALDVYTSSSLRDWRALTIADGRAAMTVARSSQVASS